ncbi:MULTISPECIES: FAD-dependent monooxygenase [unclassified Kribbella]|uniref:FAD-dependent monooxygenase n=1 Tax=unclassified Kribbella TaxID=2644121 RepID=UPI003076BD49
MRLRSVDVLGGGPGGLYVARLLKLRHPDSRVRVFEQSEPASTFGFGVGLATRTQRNLEAADPETFAAIVANSWSHEMSMTVGGREVSLALDNLIAIGRSTLLDVLRGHAADAGVEFSYNSRVSADELDAELVIAADGVNSGTRDARAEVFGARIDVHKGLYLWAGTDVALPRAVFAPVRTEYGTFVAHAYPYASDRSTFLIETDEETWRRAGFDVTTERLQFDGSDEDALAYLGEAFAEHLHGHRLIGNRTRWLRFRTVSCERWHDGNVVLLGDAAHTAHYSIGSGTKLAMEGGIALAAAIDGASDLEEALAEYERVRRPAVEHLQETAARSMSWWDSFPTRLDLPVEQLLVSYMTRAGKVSVDRFATSAVGVVRMALAQYGRCEVSEVDDGNRTEWVLRQPLGTAFPSRRVRASEIAGLRPVHVTLGDPWGFAADTLVKEIGADEALSGVLLSTAADTGSVLTMFDLAERIRREAGTLVVARLDASATDLAVGALVTERVDLVDLGGAA